MHKKTLLRLWDSSKPHQELLFKTQEYVAILWCIQENVTTASWSLSGYAGLNPNP